MNPDQFNHLIIQPAAISAAHLHSLETLSEQFPYCQLLRFLQAKPHYDQLTAQADEKVQQAAVYAISRYKLKKFLEIPAQPLQESALFETATGASNFQAIPDESALDPANALTADEKDPDVEDFNNRMKKLKQNEIIDNFIKTEPRISSLNTVKKDLLSKDLSEHSIKAPEGLISENLASIMLKQGKTDKAIEIYEKLLLKFPEKKTYFAEKIENLKNK